MAWSTTGPMVMLGTKRPSMTSTWIQSAPAASTARTSSPKRVKSADRTEGATRMAAAIALTLARRCPVDEPDELADGVDARRRHVAAAGTDRLEDRRLLLARHQERDLPAALDHRISHGDADLGPAMRHRGDIGHLQGPLVAPRGVVGRAVGRHGMHVGRRDGCPGQHGLAGHPVVAL